MVSPEIHMVLVVITIILDPLARICMTRVRGASLETVRVYVSEEGSTLRHDPIPQATLHQSVGLV